MSAPHIPNLLNLRGGPRRGGSDWRGRGRGRGGGDAAGQGGQFRGHRMQKDIDIQGTDTDAAVSRMSAVSLGYLDDAFAAHFVNGPGTRRMPVINRGKVGFTNPSVSAALLI